MKNLVLIGMPGSGKTKLSKLLGEKLAMAALDTDDMVTEASGKTIPELFETFGEGYFRDLETKACQKAAQATATIIATGGGAVLREENMTALGKTGVIFFRDRNPKAIAGENHGGRPLIGQDKARIFRLYEERLPLYQKYAHHTIAHTDTIEEAAERIVDLFKKEMEK